MTQKISSDIASLLQKAVNGSLENYEVEIDEGNEPGSGYLGDMVSYVLSLNTHSILKNKTIYYKLPNQRFQ